MPSLPRRLVSPGLVVLSLAGGLGACGGGGGDEPPPTVGTITLLDPTGTPTGAVGSTIGPVRVRIATIEGAPIAGLAVPWAPSAGTTSPASSVTDASGVATTTWTLGTTAGTQTLATGVAGFAGRQLVTVAAVADRPAVVTIGRDTTVALVPGAGVRFTAVVRDRYGNAVPAPVRWSTSDVDLAAIDSTGSFIAFNPGTVTVLATADTATGRSTVTIGRPASFTITHVPTDTLKPRADLVIDGAGFVPLGMSATIAGLPTVVGASATRLTIGVPSQAILPCAAPSLARVVVRRQLGGVVDSAVLQLPLDPATTRALQPGERAIADDFTGLQCTRLETGGTYVVSLFNTATTVPGGVAVQLRGLPVGPLAMATSPALARAPRALRATSVPRPADRAHADHLDRERARVTRLGAPVRALAAAAVPAVGDVVTLNAMYFDCATPTAIRARVAAVGTRSIVLEDVASAGSGTRDAAYRQVADEFDRVMYPLVTQHFGDPLALDAKFGGDGHVRVLFTPYVADSVPNTVGFMTGCNFYAKSQLASSNEAAVFYARLPNAAETVAEWQRNLRPTLVHETKHLAAYAERFARAGTGAPVLEETWLEEATARIAEELYARTFSGATWKGNASYAATVGCELTRCDARPLGVYKHFEALADYYARIDSLTPLGRVSPFDGTFYGSGWLLVRWAADQFAADEPSFFRALTTEVTATGLTNLVRRTGRPAPDMLADWSLAMAVDDRPGFTPKTPELAIPSWNTRDVFRGLNAYNPFQFRSPFPLLVRQAAFGDFTADVPLLRSWTAAFVEVAGPSGSRQLLSLQGRGGGAPPAGVGMAIVRVQ
ncbi:MAG: hypothetical protein JO180_03720 [Gemmatirosa sp.]|nr:hypothetical protein [Gemmatirosa sp.]